MSTCVSIDEIRPGNRSALWIDGCAVDQVFDEVYRTYRKTMSGRDIELCPEVIAWAPVLAAADRAALSGLLSAAVMHVASNTEGGAIWMRAFPSHDDVFVVFEIKNDRPARRSTDRLAAFTDMMERARSEVESMGGELCEYFTEEGGSRVCFRLPQWV